MFRFHKVNLSAALLFVSLTGSGCGQDSNVVNVVCQDPQGSYSSMTIEINLKNKTVKQEMDVGSGCLLKTDFADGEHKPATTAHNCPFAVSNDASDLIVRTDGDKIIFGDIRIPQTLDRRSGLYRGARGSLSQCSSAGGSRKF